MGLPERVEFTPPGGNHDRRYFNQGDWFIKWDSNIARGVNEATMLKRVWGKNAAFPHFISSGDLGNGWHELVMERIPGDTLEAQKLHRVEYKDVVTQLFRVAAALVAIGVIHGDINVSNLIYRNGRLSLIDWEMARQMGEGQELWDMCAAPWGIVKTISMLKTAW
jgi:RIO-like serine/threonine protein kinase